MLKILHSYTHDSCLRFSDFNSGHCQLVLYKATPEKLKHSVWMFENVSVTEIMLGLTEKPHVGLVPVLAPCLRGELIFSSL